MKEISEQTLVIISWLEEQISSMNKAVWQMLDYEYDFEFDPPSFEDEDAEWEREKEKK